MTLAARSWYVDFAWEHAPLSHWCWPVMSVVAYLVCIVAISMAMRPRGGFDLRRATAAHNLLLSFGSLAMFCGTLLELLRRWLQSGELEWLFCEDERALARGPLYFWTYIYYLSKYYEMLDTVLVLLQKSKVPHFNLQVYHHAAVVPMMWLWCQHRMSLHWAGLLFNTFVHVVMYHYYAWKVMGLPTPWKAWITKLQILQFATSFMLVIITVCILYQKEPGQTCAGTHTLWINIFLNVTLLLQFIKVDRKNKKS